MLHNPKAKTIGCLLKGGSYARSLLAHSLSQSIDSLVWRPSRTEVCAGRWASVRSLKSKGYGIIEHLFYKYNTIAFAEV